MYPQDHKRPELKAIVVSWLLALFVIGIFAVASIHANYDSVGAGAVSDCPVLSAPACRMAG